MWQRLAKFVLQFRVPLLILLLVVTGVMAYFTGKVQLSYEFAKAIPTDNPKYKEYLSFKQKFGDDGNTLVIAVQTADFFNLATYNAFARLHKALKTVPHVEEVISVSSAVNLVKNSETEKLNSIPIFAPGVATQQQLNSSDSLFFTLPFYKTLLYNPHTHAYLIGVRINREILNSSNRTGVVNDIIKLTNAFTADTKLQTYVSGLPLIRTLVANRISKEMRWFLAASLGLSALILFLFFRSVSTTLISLSVVIIGVVWSFGILYLFGYKITLLNALIPPPGGSDRHT